jgi:hypothetical protein
MRRSGKMIEADLVPYAIEKGVHLLKKRADLAPRITDVMNKYGFYEQKGTGMSRCFHNDASIIPYLWVNVDGFIRGGCDPTYKNSSFLTGHLRTRLVGELTGPMIQEEQMEQQI